jgi:hypothetical protein
MPSRTVGGERVPPLGTPSFGNSVPLDNEMRLPVLDQMLAHRQPGLAPSNDERLDFLD